MVGVARWRQVRILPGFYSQSRRCSFLTTDDDNPIQQIGDRALQRAVSGFVVDTQNLGLWGEAIVPTGKPI